MDIGAVAFVVPGAFLAPKVGIRPEASRQIHKRNGRRVREIGVHVRGALVPTPYTVHTEMHVLVILVYD